MQARIPAKSDREAMLKQMAEKSLNAVDLEAPVEAVIWQLQMLCANALAYKLSFLARALRPETTLTVLKSIGEKLGLEAGTTACDRLIGVGETNIGESYHASQRRYHGHSATPTHVPSSD